MKLKDETELGSRINDLLLRLDVRNLMVQRLCRKFDIEPLNPASNSVEAFTEYRKRMVNALKWLASETGMEYKRVHNIYLGRVDVTMDEVANIAFHLGVSTHLALRGPKVKETENVDEQPTTVTEAEHDRLKRERVQPNKNKPWAKLPKIVSRLCVNFDGWVVGSAANPANEDPRDFDVMIPFHRWHEASVAMPTEAKLNSWNGVKFNDPDTGKEIDCWPDTLDRLATIVGFQYAYHPRTGTLIHRSGI